MNKKCTRCNKVKPISKFYLSSQSKNSYRSHCKECINEYGKLYRKNNLEKERTRCRKKSKIYYLNNKEARKLYSKKYRQEHKEEIRKRNRQYAKNNPEKIKKFNKRYSAKHSSEIVKRVYLWKIDNPNKVKIAQKKYKLRTRSIIKNKINDNISKLINYSLRKNKKGNHWETLVGYTLEDLMRYLEGLFQNGMTWSNYGLGGWVIDHIIPRSLWNFNSYNDREFKQCWSLANLQPMWEIENIKKGNRI